MSDRLHDLLYRNYRSAPPSGIAPADAFEARLVLMRWIVARFFPAGRDSHILDLGCGAGELLHAAAAAGYRNLRGVDRSPAQTALARTGGTPTAEDGDLFDKLGQAVPDSLDVLVSIDVLEHLGKDELAVLMEAGYRALKPGGRWIIHLPNGESPFFGRVQYSDLTHQTVFTRHSLAQILTAWGFSSIACHEVPPMSRSWRGPLRLALWRLLRGLLRFWIAVETGDTGRQAVLTQTLLAVAVK